MKKLSLFIALAALIGLSSCSSLRIEKRHYTGGWYVDFGKDAKPQAGVNHDREEIATAETEQTEPASDVPSPVFQDRENFAQHPTTVIGENTALPETDAADGVKSESTTAEKAGQNNATTPVAVEPPKEPAPGSQPADTRLILEFILALILPPLAIFLHEGVTTIFWIDLICFLFVISWFTPFGYGGFLHLLSIVLAMLVIFDVL